MKSLGWALIQCDRFSYNTWKLGTGADRHTGRMPREDRNRDWSEVSESQRRLKIDSNSPEAGKRHGTDFPS